MYMFSMAYNFRTLNWLGNQNIVPYNYLSVRQWTLTSVIAKLYSTYKTIRTRV